MEKPGLVTYLAALAMVLWVAGTHLVPRRLVPPWGQRLLPLYGSASLGGQLLALAVMMAVGLLHNFEVINLSTGQN